MTGRVIVVGSVNVDLVATVERLPSAGETVTGGRFGRHHGGKGGNQAVAAARLGAPTTYVGAVGDDDFGTDARAALAAEGVDVAGLRTLAGEPTGVALILVDERGENVIAVASGANAAVTADMVRESLASLAPGPGDIVLVGHEIPTSATRAALAAGRSAGATTVLNPAPATGLDRSVFGLADVLVPNRTELGQLLAAEARRVGRPTAGADRPDVGARTLLEPNAEGEGVGSAVLVTLGAGGAVLVRRGAEPLDLAPPRVTVVDTVGAGDALCGALAAALAARSTLEDAARRAVLAGSLATTRAGAREGMPTRAELDAAAERLVDPAGEGLGR
ncbi:MAG TPA: ribokinase [Candidatus Limnocylindrales bacterium]|nr:ribokinase [Candidatus Limnocylindrales bacterium]